MLLLDALFLATGLAIGGALGFVIAWTRNAPAREELAALHARAEEQEIAAADKLAFATNTRHQLADAFKALSAQALDSTSATFLQLATATLEKHQTKAQGDLEARQQAVDALVQPIKESLTKVDGKIEQLERNRLNAYSALNEQLRSLVETHLPQLRSETGNLVKALRQPITRGRWGELQLKRVVELAGMLEHCDFEEQPSSATTEDGRQRPDLIVKLPGDRQIVIDAKVPIAAYLDAHEAQEDDARAKHLQRHAELVRTHAKELGRKAYWDTFSPSPDFVIMFLPDMLYIAALQQDASLIEAVTNERVVLATPGSLIALLRTIALVWREQKLALNAQEVAQLGRQLYERVGSLATHWSDVGDKLEKAVGAYNRSVGALETRVLVTARKFDQLGVTAAGDGEIVRPEPVESLPRPLLAPELIAREAGATPLERVGMRVS